MHYLLPPLTFSSYRKSTLIHLLTNFSHQYCFFQWSCLKQFPLGEFGSACNLNILSTNTSILTVSNGSMSLNSAYTFTVVVLSDDERSGSWTITVLASNGAAQVLITSSSTRFNPSAKLVLGSSISAKYAANFTWSVYTFLGEPVDIISLTPKLVLFPGSNELNAISFPFSVIGGIFSPGKAYTFQLLVYSTNNQHDSTISDITLTANSAPTNGYIVSSPAYGSALVTQFTVSSPGWTADADSFPLSYAFSFRMLGTSTNLTLAASSVRPYTTTMLPAGAIVLQTQVTDIYFTSATATTNVVVTSARAANVSHVLESTLVTAFAAGNINLAIQTVNNVSMLYLSRLLSSAVS